MACWPVPKYPQSPIAILKTRSTASSSRLSFPLSLRFWIFISHRDVPMSSGTRSLSCVHRLRSRFSGLHVATIGALLSLLYLFYVFAVPQLRRLHLRTDLSWYDLGLYGFGPSQDYVSFDYESPALQISEQGSGCDSRFTFLAPRGDSVAQPGPMILDSRGELIWMKHNWEITQDFRVQRYQGADYLTYWEGDEIEGRGYGAWYMVGGFK